MYGLIKPLLFKMDPEKAHYVTLQLLKRFSWLMPAKSYSQEVMIAGLKFKNPVGLAAGIDKDGEYIDVLAKLGVGFIEVGGVTPRPQAGNQQPRLFRLTEDEAIINRMGFNNGGVDNIIENIKKAKYQGVIGLNIAKNMDTPIENAVDDYLTCIRKAYAYFSFITVNISSPNTKNLRDLQSVEALDALLGSIKKEQALLAEQHQKETPLFIKVAPDLNAEQIKDIAALLIKHKIEGLIATNTLVNKPPLKSEYKDQQGGLSGKPIFEHSLAVVKQFHEQLGDQVPIIAVGGINSKARMQAMLDAGAVAIQFYSGLVYDANIISKLLS